MTVSALVQLRIGALSGAASVFESAAERESGLANGRSSLILL